MALPTSPPISLNQIKEEFGATGSRSLTEFYRGGAFVPNIPQNSNIPTSGAISLLDFLGAANYVPINELTPVTITGGGLAPSSASANYQVLNNGTVRSTLGTVSPSGALPETWLGSGASASDYRVRFRVVSRSPTNTVIGNVDTWLDMSTNPTVTLTASGSQNPLLNTLYTVGLDVEFALAGTTTPIYSVPVTLRVSRSA